MDFVASSKAVCFRETANKKLYKMVHKCYIKWLPATAIQNKFLAPVLSAQFITAPTGKAREMRNLLPDGRLPTLRPPPPGAPAAAAGVAIVRSRMVRRNKEH